MSFSKGPTGRSTSPDMCTCGATMEQRHEGSGDFCETYYHCPKCDGSSGGRKETWWDRFTGSTICSDCGKRVDSSNNYCPKCGNRI